MLKGTKELEQAIDKFIEPFGLSSKLDTDFAYYFEKDLVTFSLFQIDAYNDFILDAESRFPSVLGVHPFMWSLLHEVGHHETWDELTEEEIEESMQIKDSIDTDNHSSKMSYYTCPDEYAATDWAGHYLEENREEVEDFWESLIPLFREFYKLNDVEAD
jgi:hypothetical protein